MSKWDVDVDINQVIYNATKKLNYDLEFGEDRVSLVNEIISDLDKDGLLTNYLSSEGFISKQVKTKSSFLSETEPFSKALSRFSFYIDFAKFDNELAKLNKLETPSTLSQYKFENYPIREGLTGDFSKLKNDDILDIDFQNQARKKDKNFRLAPMQQITDKDRHEFSELNDYFVFFEMLNDMLGMKTGVTKIERIKTQQKLANKYGDKYLQMLKRVRTELKKEMPLIKDRIRGTIYFKKIDKGHPEYNLDNDTGYFNESGDYIEVSENKIDLSVPEHIFAVINNYAELREGVWDKPDSDLWIILHEVEKLIESSLDPFEKDIVVLKIDKLNGEEICNLINEKYGMELSERNLSRIFNEVLPKKLAETHKDIYEEWLYTYQVKGTYKTCSKCCRVKLKNERFFRKRSDKKGDGHYNQCRKCESDEKA